MRNSRVTMERLRHLGLKFVMVLLLNQSRVACLEMPGTFTAGVVSSLTGPFAEWSDAVNGYKLWEKELAAAGGLVIRDANGSTYRYGIKLVVYDDASTAEGHGAFVAKLLREDNVHFVLGASPVFADAEAVSVHASGRLNFHCCSGASSVYAREQKNVFGMSIDNALYAQELLTEFRAADVYKLAVILRDDILELEATCEGVVAQAKLQLLTVSLELRYADSSNATLQGLVQQLAASSAEALVMCGLEQDSSAMVQLIHAKQKPLKAIVLTNGAYKRAWNDRLGNLSVGLLSFAHWSPDLPRKDDFWGDSASYSGKYKSVYGSEATYTAAAASATGYVLQAVLSQLFLKCSLSPAAQANPSTLMFTEGAIDCPDNNNRGHDRLITALSAANMNTFFGAVAFDRFRQNHGYSSVTLQTYETSDNLQQAYKPSLVLPLNTAARPLLLPQPNRYAPICQPGTFRGPDDFAPCTPCSLGEFQEFSNRKNCELCPRDSYANASAMPNCLSCPANTYTLQRGSTNLTDCICKVNFYNKAGMPGLPCEPCPENAICEGGTSLPYPVPGFYAEQDAPYTMYPCNPARICTGNFTCARGYRGRMCARCDEGYFRFLGNCASCPQDKSNVLGYLIILAALWVTINVYFARTVENLMVVVNFCQLISLVVGFSLNWPQKLYQVMSLSSIFSFEIDSLEPTCLVPGWGFAHNLVVQQLLPLIMAALVGVWCLITSTIYKLKQARLTRSAKAAISLKLAMEAPWKQVLWDILDVAADKQEFRDMLLERAAVPLNFLNIGFLVLLKYNLSTFNCTTIMGVKYLAASPNDRCYTPQHWNLMLIGISGLICYNLGFVVLYGHVMRQLRKYRALGDKTPLLLYGWMYERYEAQFYWYETVMILQRVVFVLVSVFVRDPALQAVLCMLVSVGTLVTDMRTSAYVDKLMHLLQATSEGVLGALLVAGLLFYNPLSDKAVVIAIEYLLLCAVAIAFISAAVSVVHSMVVRLLLMWLMSKHRPIAYKMGQRVKGYRHVYKVFGPLFLFKWLWRCTPEEWDDWHRFCMVLIDYVHPTSEVSYLSLKKVGRFWRYLLSNFPETIDYLVSVEEDQRAHFNSFIEELYDNFFDTKEEHHYQVYYYINDKFKAPFAQWLSSCNDDDRYFCQQVMKTALGKTKGTQAATELSAAMSRANKIANAAAVAVAVERFKKARPGAPLPPRTSMGGNSVRFKTISLDAGTIGDQPDRNGGPNGGSPRQTKTQQLSSPLVWSPGSLPESPTVLKPPTDEKSPLVLAMRAAAAAAYQRSAAAGSPVAAPSTPGCLSSTTPGVLTAVRATGGDGLPVALREPVTGSPQPLEAPSDPSLGGSSPQATCTISPGAPGCTATATATVTAVAKGLTTRDVASPVATAKLPLSSDLPCGDAVIPLGDPDLDVDEEQDMVVAGEVPGYSHGNEGGEGRRSPPPPLALRGDSADSMQDLDRGDLWGGASAVMLPVPRNICTPRLGACGAATGGERFGGQVSWRSSALGPPPPAEPHAPLQATCASVGSGRATEMGGVDGDAAGTGGRTAAAATATTAPAGFDEALAGSMVEVGVFVADEVQQEFAGQR